MKKKIYVALVVLSFAVLSAGCSFFGKKDGAVPEEVVQSSVDVVQEENVQISVDETHLDLLEKMMIVKDEEVFNSEFLVAPCTLYQAYELLNTMKGQDGAAVSFSYHGQQITQKDLLTLYLKELFGIEVTEAEGSSFEFYANELEVKDYFNNKEAEATNNHLISLTYACVLYGLDDWKNTKTVFQQMLESGYFNDTDITTFENAAMDDIFNYGTLKCPATEIYDEHTGRTYYFVNYFGNSYRSSTKKNLAAIGMGSGGKEILIRPYFSQQNNTADGTGFVFTRFPGGLTYLYDIETQTTKYIDTVSCSVVGSNYVYLSKSDKMYYIKEVDGKSWVYRKDLKSDSEPEKIVSVVNSNLIHVTDDEKYLSVMSSDSNYKDGKGQIGFIRVDIESKKLEVVAHHSITTTKVKGTNAVGHATINPVYPELYFFAHIVDDAYLYNIPDRANILNVDTGEVIAISPGNNPDKAINNLPYANILFTHESWSENGEYLYITNLGGTAKNVPMRGMVRVDKDGTHYKYITNPVLATDYWHWGYSFPFLTNHASASGDDRYCALEGYYMAIISQETNQLFPIAQIYNLKIRERVERTKHPFHAHPTVSRGDTYLVNWGQYYVPQETIDDPDSGTLGVAYFDFTDIDENELAKGGEFEYNEYVSRLSYEGRDKLTYAEQLMYANLDCESEEGTFFEKESLHAKAGNYVYFNINTSIVDNMNDTVTITFDYYDNGAQDLKLIYTKAVEDENDYCHSEDGSVDIACTNTGEWKRAELVVHGNFETSGKYGTDFKIGSASSDVYVTNIQVKKN